MFEGIYFQFPKLGFILFFFLACEALCPLRSNPLYFPRPALFGEVGVKPPIWLWIAKWAMIVFLIVALMSPVRDREIARHERGWDILIIIEPSLVDSRTLPQMSALIDSRPEERIALWIPPMTVVPLTYDHRTLISVLKQTPEKTASISINRAFSSFFATSREGKKLAVILTNRPKTFVSSLPDGIQTAVISPMNEPRWANTINSHYPPYKVQDVRRYFDYYYVYPLLLAFLSMLAYLYGRNQKGIR